MDKLTAGSIGDWCQGRPIQVVIFAQSFVHGIDRLHRILSTLKSGELQGKPPETNIKKWLSLYLAKRKLLDVILDESQKRMPPGSPPNMYRDVILKFFQLKKIADLEHCRQVNGQQYSNNKLPEFKGELRTLKNDLLRIVHLPLAGAIDEFNEEAKMIPTSASLPEGTPEKFFISNVWIPSILLYGVFPPVLLRNARLGDLESLENLARLDKSIIFDRVISERFHKLRLSDPGQAQRFFTLINKTPKITATRKNAKYLAGGLLQYVSKNLSLITKTPPLSAPDIHRLFDAYAKDKGSGDQDQDFATIQNDSVYRGIKEACEHWTAVFSPGIK